MCYHKKDEILYETAGSVMRPAADRALENSVKDAEGAKNSQAKGQSSFDSAFPISEFTMKLVQAFNGV